uniref:oxysterol-binding protein-related protein 8-like isoform X2 n=1 Tax=Myxine glutinosa TaxID=7769 RepID=UPI00358FE9D0
MTLEFGGKVMIECEKTGYKAEVEFKLKPFLGSSDTLNMITGKIKLGKQTLCTLEGHWDQEVFIQENGSTASEPFWTPTVEIRNQRLQRCIVPQNEQFPFESERLWQHVTQAILDRDQNLATHEKSLLEEAQRQSARHRKETGTIWLPRLFHQDISGSWHYRYSDTRPWDALNDVLQFEKYGVIRAKMKHGPCIAPVLGLGGASVGSKNYHSDELDLLKHKGNIHRRKCSTPDPQHQDSSDNDELLAERLRTRRQRDLMEIRDLMTSIQRTQEDINRRTKGHTMEVVSTSSTASPPLRGFSTLGEICVKVYMHVKIANHGFFPRSLLITKVTRTALGGVHTSASLNILCFVAH